jgi:anti-sigma regulatory factor (Ser/Thr protein kinase)
MRQTRTFEHAPESVMMARRFAAEALRGAPAETLESVGLMVSELASNSVLHTDSRFDLSIMLTAGEIRVEATDHGGGEPCLRSPAPSDLTGRGLLIVDALASAWGVEHRGTPGKTVWFAITSNPAANQDAPSTRQPASSVDH